MNKEDEKDEKEVETEQQQQTYILNLPMVITLLFY